MRSIFTCTIAALILTACSQTSITSTPLPEFTPTTKFTLTPRLTETPSPQSLLPQEVKEKFELAGIDLAQMENAEYDKDGLHITLAGGEVIVLTNTDLQKGIYLGQDNVLQYRDEANQNAIYTFDKESGKWGVEVIKEYPICATENFRDCPIPVEDLFNGNYHRWLETLSQPFDQSKIKDVPFWDLGEVILYDEKTAPNFDDPSTAPFRRDVTIGMVFLEIEGVRYPYIVKPIEFFDKNEPEKNKWVITVDPFGDIETGPDSDDIMYEWGIQIWQEEMNVTPILTSAISNSSDLEDPLVKQTFDNNPDMQERFDRFILGDVSALSEQGIVLLTTDGIHATLFR